MTQKEFLHKGQRDKYPRQADLSSVRYPDITKHTSSIGGIPIHSLTGKVNKNRIQLWWKDSSSILSIEATKESVKSTIRRLRPTEAKLLEEIDTKMLKLRIERLAILKQAWQKGHVVTVKELKERII